jgi:hypothetical protein
VPKSFCQKERFSDSGCTSPSPGLCRPRSQAILDLGARADDCCMAEELLDEAIGKASKVGAESAVTLLERARGEAQQEYRRVVREMKALEPERG